MRAAFHDPAGLQHDDLVGIDHGGQPVCDDQRGAALRDLAQRPLDFPLGMGVERTGRLIEQQDRRPLQDGAGNRHALLLAARQFQPALAHARAVAIRQRQHEIMHLGETRRLLDLRRGGSGPAIGNVVVDRVVEQHRVLRDDADGGAQGGLGQFADILPVDADRAAIHVVEAEQQARDGRFAGAAGPDDGDGLARRHLEADIFQDRPVRAIAEADIAEFHGGVGGDEIDRSRAVLDLALDAQQAEHRLHVDQRLLHLAIDEAQEVQRHVELDQIAIHQHEIAYRHAGILHAMAGHHHDRDQPDGDDGALADIQQRQGGAALHRRIFIAPERIVEAPRLMRLIAKILHRLIVQQAVDGLGVGLLVGLVHGAAELDAPFGDRQGEGDIAGDGREGDQREPEIVQHPQDAADQQDFQDRRHDVEQHEVQQELDALGAALDDA